MFSGGEFLVACDAQEFDDFGCVYVGAPNVDFGCGGFKLGRGREWMVNSDFVSAYLIPSGMAVWILLLALFWILPMADEQEVAP